MTACSSLSGFLGSSAGMFFMQQYKKETVIFISMAFSVFESAWADWRGVLLRNITLGVSTMSACLFQAKDTDCRCLSVFCYGVF